MTFLVLLHLTRAHEQQSELRFHESSSTNGMKSTEVGSELALKMVVTVDLNRRSACF